MQGFLIGLALSLAVLAGGVAALSWVHRRELAREFPETEIAEQGMTDVWGEPDAPVVVDTANTVILAPVGEPPARARRLVRVEDELGVWEPGAHVQEEPLVLGDVYASGEWPGVRPADVGLEAS